MCLFWCLFFFFSSRRRHTRCSRDWSSDVCSSDLLTWQFDVALARSFRVREEHSIEFRAEAFNVLNSFRAGVPPGAPNTVSVVDTNLTSAQFGKILNSLEPRVMQFALKYLF